MNDEDFTDIKMNLGIILRGDVDSLKKLKEAMLESAEKLNVICIYQKTSSEKLRIEYEKKEETR